MVRPDLAFSQWLAVNYPELFGAALTAAQSPTQMGLNGWGDIFSSIGSAIGSTVSNVAQWGSSAVGAVASYVSSPAGQSAMGKLANLYVTTQANKDAVSVQLANLAQSRPPAPIATNTNAITGVTTPVYAPAGQAPQPLTPQLSQQLYAAASQPQNYIVPIALGGGALLLYLLKGRRRSSRRR